MAALAPLVPYTRIPYEKVFFLRVVECLRVVGAIHRAGACVGPRRAWSLREWFYIK